MKLRVRLWRSGFYHYVTRLNSISDGWTACRISFTAGEYNKVRRYWPFWGMILCPRCEEAVRTRPQKGDTE